LKSILSLVIASASVLPFAAAQPSYNRDIRPILSENCFLCHGPDPEHRGGDLRLDIREEALTPHDGETAIVPGKPEQSAMIKRILDTDPENVMPPPKAHLAALKPEQIQMLKDWIKAGAVYESHWAFNPPQKAALPGKPDANPVDAFVRSRLAKEKLNPAPPATAEIQVRRLFLDLTGLPPTPAESAAFISDNSPDRLVTLADNLMATPAFAERMTMPWLDAARYSDTHGFSIDDHRDMWGWRDWVIASFLKNQPYDQFLTEQLAGDLIAGATPDQIAATGFLRNSMNTHEGGTIEEEYRAAQVIDKVDAVATTMLGLTVKCAQCHDHKYDPISQKDYYQFYAFFNQSSEPGLGATNSSTPPVMAYQSPLGDGGLQGVKNRIASLDYLRLHPSPEIVKARDAWEAGIGKIPAVPASFPWPEFDSSTMKWIWEGTPQDVESVNLRKEFAITGKVEQAWIFHTCDNTSKVTINGQPAGEIALWSTPFLGDVTSLVKDGANLIEAVATNAGGAGGFIAVLAVRSASGWEFFPTDPTWQANREAAAPWVPAQIVADLGSAPWDDVTASVKSPPDALAPIRAAVSSPPDQRTDEQWKTLTAAFAKSTDPLASRTADILRTLDVEIGVMQRDIDRGSTSVMVMDHQPELRKTHILIRGAFDQPGDEVTPGTLSALPTPNFPENPTRIDLAKWITGKDNPLTARVAVNRVWQMIFGRGIVETAGDFGNQGSWPTHPELLDWLAVDFMESGWDFRHLIRTIVASETYRQSAEIRPELLEYDPRDQLFSRSPRPRLAAEVIRDQALTVSGLLDRTLGGPGVHPPQPELWSEISHFGYPHSFTSQIFLPDRGPATHRRSIYSFWKRTSPPPSLALFDTPTRETCAVVRGNTNTPLQALVLMNEPQYVEAALALGRRLIAEGGAVPDERITLGFKLVTGRAPSSPESELLNASYTKHLARYTADPAATLAFAGEPSPELATCAMLSSILLNLDEFVSRP
jgi:hypothetical protein